MGVLGRNGVPIYVSNKGIFCALHAFPFHFPVWMLLIVYGNLELANDFDIILRLNIAFPETKSQLLLVEQIHQLMSPRCQSEPNQGCRQKSQWGNSVQLQGDRAGPVHQPLSIPFAPENGGGVTSSPRCWKDKCNKHNVLEWSKWTSSASPLQLVDFVVFWFATELCSQSFPLLLMVYNLLLLIITQPLFGPLPTLGLWSWARTIKISTHPKLWNLYLQRWWSRCNDRGRLAA